MLIRKTRSTPSEKGIAMGWWLGGECGSWCTVHMLTPKLVREKDTQAKNSDTRRATCLGKVESGAIHQACGIQARL